MTDGELESLRYPIGRYKRPDEITPEILSENIAVLASFPSDLRRETENLSDEQLDAQYRPGGWTIRQVAHHCADSHLNAWLRFKFSSAENTPIAKPYEEADWAEMPDARSMPVEPSLKLIEGLHERWVFLLKSFDALQWKRGFFHPEHHRIVSLDETSCLYAWHSRHHLAHITTLKKSKGWV